MNTTPSLSNFEPLTEAEVEELEAFIFSPAVEETALDYLGLHGLLTAFAISPQAPAKSEWLDIIFDGQPTFENAEQKQRIETLISREFNAIAEELNSGEDPLDLPCDLSLDDEEGTLPSWCQGFMEGVFLQEDIWFENNEEMVAEMLLPMMMASELFDEEEFSDLLDNAQLSQKLCNEIPDLITDLYLYFRVPETLEPAKPYKKPGAKTGKKYPSGKKR